MLNGEQLKEVIEELEGVKKEIQELFYAQERGTKSKARTCAFNIETRTNAALRLLKGNDIVNRSRDNW